MVNDVYLIFILIFIFRLTGYIYILFFFQNEENFIQLDELDESDRISHAWIWFEYSLTQAQKTF